MKNLEQVKEKNYETMAYNADDAKEALKKEFVSINFKDEDEFFEFLEFMGSADSWEKVDLTTLNVQPIGENEPMKPSTGVSVRINGRYYPLIAEGKYSLERRAEVGGSYFMKASPEDYAETINPAWKYAYKKEKPATGIALIRGENLLGVHSSLYVPFRQDKVYSAYGKYLFSTFEEFEFSSACYQHNVTEAEYKIFDDDLIRDYIARLNTLGYMITPSEISIATRLRTSDTGKSSVSVHPVISLKSKQAVPFGIPLKIEHKNGTQLSDVEEMFTGIFSLVKDSIQHLQEMAQVELNYPESVAIRVMRKYNLPKKAVIQLQPDFQWYEINKKCMNAHDFYMTICDILNTSQFDALNRDRKLDVLDALSKMIYLKEADWKKFDKPTAEW